MGLNILGIGTAVPAHSIGQQEAAELAKEFCCRTDEETQLLPLLYRKTRVKRRGSVLLEKNADATVQSFFPPAEESAHGPTTQQRMERYAREAVPLAVEASRRALAAAQVQADRIGQLVTVSCTGFQAPGFDVALIRDLGLPRTTGRIQVGFMGCHGAINGLRTAQALVEARPESRVLLSAVELCSLHFHYGWDPEKIVANALFADGAASLVAGSGAAAKNTDGWRVEATGSMLFPDSEEAMTWRIGDHGFVMTLSARVPSLITAHLKPWLEEWLASQGVGLKEVRSWAIHPGGPRILSSVVQSLGLPDQSAAVSAEVLAQQGNMSSATLLFILKQLMETRAPRPCVALGFGPGLVAEAALLR